MPGRLADSDARHMLGVFECMPGALRIMPGRSADSASRRMPREIALGGDHSARPPNPPLQPTAARTRSFAFWQSVAARSRQLNGNPFGRSFEHRTYQNLFP
jgi:hypothetical protein